MAVVQENRQEMLYRIFDNELDLSFEDLPEVPLENIKDFSSVIVVDLSNNRIQTIPNEFPTYFQNLFHLDLSYNYITSLPANFGLLASLRHLDLSGNEIRHLELSFSKLINLEWLNLKGNPLIPVLKEVTEVMWGVDEYYCCAKSIVAFMEQVDSFGNSIGYDASANESVEVDAQIEVLFSRTKNAVLHSDKFDPNGGEHQEGVLVEDHAGQFYYVTFGKKLKNLRPSVAPMKSFGVITGQEMLLPSTLISYPKPSATVVFIKRLFKGVLLCITIALFCNMLMSMAVNPNDLQYVLNKFFDPAGQTSLIILKSHSGLQRMLNAWSYLFPLAFPPPSLPKGFWQGIMDWFYATYWNYNLK